MATFNTRYATTDLPITKPQKHLLFGFDPSLGPGYVWHCHILDHEDNEMMWPYAILASPFHTAKLKSATTEVSDVSSEVTLAQNAPNPVISETEIQFSVPEAMHVNLALYDNTGRLVQMLINDIFPAGINVVKLNVEDLPADIYIYQLNAGNFIGAKKMVVIK